MIFNVHNDSGDKIFGTVIPDSYSGICNIRVISGKKEIGVFPTDQLNVGVRDIGFHETGLVDFVLTEQALPGLSGFGDLEIHDAESDMLIYRRLQPGMLVGKYLRIETHLFPLWQLDSVFEYRFQQYYRGIETFGLNTTRQLFHLSQDSIYVSGRIQIKNFMFCVGNGFKLLVMLHDPYEELAERLLVLNRVATMNPSPFSEREMINMRNAIAYAATLPLSSETDLKRAISKMPLDVSLLLANPVVRQLSTTNLDDQPTLSGVASALDILSQALAVGLRAEPEQFAKAIGELFHMPSGQFPIQSRFPKVIEFAEMLRSWRYCEGILEKDLELYAHIIEAHRASASNNLDNTSANAGTS